MDKCKICQGQTQLKFESLVLKKYKVKYFQCPDCQFLFTEEPYWLSEAYQHAINVSDTGLLSRNQYFAKQVSSLIYLFFDKNGMFLDYAGGYGIFTRLMRDIGFNFYWKDEYCENLLAKGFEFENSASNKVEALTAFEVFEHFSDPIEEINKISKLSDTIIFSTEILPDQLPTIDWWYYGFEHGQHLSFYSKTSLDFLAKKIGLKYYSARGLHILTKNKLNSTALKLILNLNRVGLFRYVKRRMKSKIWEDHLKMK